MTDEAKRLKGMEGSELKKAESQERLHALADEEQANRRELGDLLNRSESLFKEASRNSQIDPAGMKEFMKGISMLKPIPDGSMKMAQKLFRDSASESRSEQESRKDLDDGENSHSEATQALKDTMNQLSKSAQDMEASTFVARLKQAAAKEDSIANALAGQINIIVGMTMDELDPPPNGRWKPSPPFKTPPRRTSAGFWKTSAITSPAPGNAFTATCTTR
ncbi:MAG: hypothetical protein ACLT8E_07485 [Akkermansia sp.]